MKYPLKNYQIWVGWNHLGQGYHPSTEPKMVGEVRAPSFRVACFLYELRRALNSVEYRINNDEYVDHQSCRWSYDFDENRNDWTGKYFQTKEEAEKTFL